MPTIKIKQKETDIVRAIMDYLSLRKHFFWKNNTGALKTEHGFIRFGSVGSPDICVIHNGFIGLEVKTDKGVVSEFQQKWGKECIKAGGNWFIVRNIDDVQSLGL